LRDTGIRVTTTRHTTVGRGLGDLLLAVDLTGLGEVWFLEVGRRIDIPLKVVIIVLGYRPFLPEGIDGHRGLDLPEGQT
jgi:hypothetical protein